MSLGELKEKDVMNMLCGIASKWRLIGNQFGLTKNELDGIRMTNIPPKECLLEVIATKKAHTTHFWWTDIVEALFAIKEDNLANRICQKYRIVRSITPGMILQSVLTD